MSTRRQWMVYGANGYTGRLIAKRAVALGMKPVLAGRNRDEVRALADGLGLTFRVFALEQPKRVEEGLDGMALVLHSAGPFSITAAPMIEACLSTGTHYLDITGEIAVYEHAHRQDFRAKQAGILVVPGVGFDVVPTDCLAARLKHALPTATELVLAFDAGGGPSRGTAKSGVEGLAQGGRIRREGRLEPVPLAYRSRSIPFPSGSKSAVTIPWGDVYTAYVSTGIPNIEVYMAMAPERIKQLERLQRVHWWVRQPWVQALMKWQIDRRRRGPTDAKRQASHCEVWGEVADAAGRRVQGTVITPNGYDFTAISAVHIAAKLLGQVPAAGFRTPSQLFGPELLDEFEQVQVRIGS